MDAPCVEINLQSSANEPGRSDIVTHTLINLPSATKALSKTLPKTVVYLIFIPICNQLIKRIKQLLKIKTIRLHRYCRHKPESQLFCL